MRIEKAKKKKELTKLLCTKFFEKLLGCSQFIAFLQEEEMTNRMEGGMFFS